MQDDFDPCGLSLPVGHFIDGELVTVAGEGMLDVLRPSDGGLLGQIPDAGADTVDRAVSSAHRAWRQSGWASRPPRQRAKAMLRWADLIEENGVELARLEAASSTRPIAEALAWDVPFTAEAIRFFAECADKYGGSVFATPQDHLGMLVAEPLGVIGAITPWNFPLSMASWKCGPALAAGNAVVLKASEMTPYTTLALARLAIEAGIPPGILNIVSGAGATAGAAIVRHPLVVKVSFTGSTAAGAEVMALAARHGIKPVTLELGGKSPQLVFDDIVSVSDTAAHIVRGFIANSGQSCVAGSRLIVQRGVAEPLLEAIERAIAAVRPGVTWLGSSRFSPIISRRQIDRIASLTSGVAAAGAEILVGGGSFEDEGYPHFYRPTVIAGVRSDMPVVQEEVFGPVLTVQTFGDEEEGLALADHPVYGLAAGVHTRDMGKALRAMQSIQAGTIWINRYGRTDDFIVPTGGFKGSGIGKDLGRQAFEASQRFKSVVAAVNI